MVSALGVCVVALTCFVSGSWSGCPFLQKSVDIARTQYKNQLARERQLFDNGYWVKPTAPGTLLNKIAPVNAKNIELAAQSNTLLLAQQNYQTQERDLFSKSLDQCLDESLRCAAVEKCTDSPYRTLSGACNNKQNPKWGAARTQYTRLLQPSYTDNIHVLRRTFKTDNELPSVRLVANKALQGPAYTNGGPLELSSYFGILFGQYISHDMGLRELIQDDRTGYNPQCCTSDYSARLPANLTNTMCDAVTVPKDDPFLGPKKIGCLNNYRSHTVVPNSCKLEPAQQVNHVTAFVDGSNMYGSLSSVSDDLRTGSGGQYKNNKAEVLPVKEGCKGPLAECYSIGGDGRVTQTPMLAIVHSLPLRLHNKVAQLLAEVNPHWDDNRLFNEARKISIAFYQHVVYEEWMPVVFGKQSAYKLGLSCGKDAKSCGNYNPNVDPGAVNENSHASFRLFHLYVPSIFRLINNDQTVLATKMLSELVLQVEIAETNYNDILRGMFLDKMSIAKFSDEMINKMPTGLDLLTNDIQKGRDHGFQPYGSYYEYCTKKKVNSWNDLLPVFEQKDLDNLRKVYEDVNDLDLMVGIFLEKKGTGYMGAVAECITGEQFARSKFGDRFFYTFPGQFTADQMTELKSFSMAKYLCSVTSLEKVTANPFVVPGNKINTPTEICSKFPKINLKAWQEKRY